MREIKFRAWHKDAKKMIYSSSMEMSYTTNGSEGSYAISVAFSLGELPATRVIDYGERGEVDTIERLLETMQYTGLKDKNGVEIYEGDIVRYTPPSGKTKKAKKPYNDMVVVWGAGTEHRKTGWYVLWRGENGNLYDRLEHAVSSNHKVIGNIYENKELLNA